MNEVRRPFELDGALGTPGGPAPPEPGPVRCPARGSVFRRFVRATVSCIVVLVIVDCWLLQGLLSPIVVSSNSMAPALWGPHAQWTCHDCGSIFNCGIDELPPAGKPAICPNCGAANNPERHDGFLGDRVFVDRSTLQWRYPRRWEPIVFRCPDEPRLLCVKRVAGLPGETVQIQQGDVIIDGRIARKTAADSDSTRITVYEAPAGDAQWQTSGLARWNQQGSEFVHGASPSSRRRFNGRRTAPQQIDWLVYHHRNQVTQNETAPPPILDDNPVDQNESRQLNPVDDVTVSCEAQAAGAGAIFLRVRSRGHEFTLQIDVESGAGELSHNGSVVQLVSTAIEPFARFRRVELTLVDGVAIARYHHQVLAEFPYESTLEERAAIGKGQAGPGSQDALAIGVESASVELRKLSVLRDIYYLAAGGDETIEYQLAEDEYFLLGDNSPRAVDSRVWSPKAALAGDMIVGRALWWPK